MLSLVNIAQLVPFQGLAAQVLDLGQASIVQHLPMTAQGSDEDGSTLPPLLSVSLAA